MKKERLLKLAGVIAEQSEDQQLLSDLYSKLLQDLDALPRNEIKEFLQQIAGEFGIDLNESVQLTEEGGHPSTGTKHPVDQMADIFAAAIDAEGLQDGDVDALAEAATGLMDALHEELKERGYYG